MKQERIDGYITKDRALQTVGGVLLLLCSGILGWAVNQLGEVHESIFAISERLTAVETNRYTIQDGKDDEAKAASAIREVWREISGIRERIARIPAFSTEDAQDIKTRLALIEQTLLELKDK